VGMDDLISEILDFFVIVINVGMGMETACLAAAIIQVVAPHARCTIP
jgi:hypothetical protein